MNQILYIQGIENDIINSNTEQIKLKNKKYLIFFSISILFALLLFIYIVIHVLNSKSNNLNSKKLLQSFAISTLYSEDNSYSTSLDSSFSKDPFIIGIIEIEKINLNYPILSYSTEESLKISPCRFAGPEPNEVGNLCIAGHNNVDNSFFGKLNLLSLGDIIRIYDLSGNRLNYKIYAKDEINSSDLSCTSQETNGEKHVTLITCNSLIDTRIIYKAKEESV